MPIHAVYKASSTSTKIMAVFDASAKTTTSVSFNETLLLGPTIHPRLVDVILHFRTHKVALTTDVSKMYRAVRLAESDKDYHRFVWRKNKEEPIRDYRLTRLTFGVAASSFAANMAIRWNAKELSKEFPQASKATLESFNDGLTGGSSIQETIQLRRQLQDLFSRAGFKLKKWNSNESQVLDSIPTKRNKLHTNYLRVSELRSAEQQLLLLSQAQTFHKELVAIWCNKRLSITDYLLHGDPRVVYTSLSNRFHIIERFKAV